MNSKAIKELISAYIDCELSEKERKQIESIIKSNPKWDAEYKAMRQTAQILSRMEKLSVPEEFVKKVSTSVTLSKKDRQKKSDSKFSLNLPRSPIFQYLTTVVALGLIVFAGSYFVLMQRKQNEKYYDSELQKEQEWMDRQVAKQDQELLKQGYRWYFLRLEENGSFRIMHIGESKPKTAEEISADNNQEMRAEKDKSAVNSDLKKSTAPGAQTAPEKLKSLGYIEGKKIADADESIKEESAIKKEDEKLAASAPKAAAPPAVAAVKGKEEKIAEQPADSAKVSGSSAQSKTDNVKAKTSKPEQAGRKTQAAQKNSRSLNIEGEKNFFSSDKRYSMKSSIENRFPDDNKFRGDERQVPVPPQPEYIPPVSFKNDGLVRNPVLQVRIELLQDGTVSNVEIISGSGNKWLDIAVRKSLMKARFFKPEITGPDGKITFDLQIEVK